MCHLSCAYSTLYAYSVQISMMGGMVKDVFDFLMLLILVLLGFAGALTTLFASDVDIEDDPGYVMTDPDCVMLMGRNSSLVAVCTAPHSHPRTAADQ